MSMLALSEGVGLNLKELGLAESESKKLDYKRLRNDISKKIECWNERSMLCLLILAVTFGICGGRVHE